MGFCVPSGASCTRTPALWIALVIIVLLDLAALATLLAFWEASRVAAVLLIPR